MLVDHACNDVIVPGRKWLRCLRTLHAAVRNQVSLAVKVVFVKKPDGTFGVLDEDGARIQMHDIRHRYLSTHAVHVRHRFYE